MMLAITKLLILTERGEVCVSAALLGIQARPVSEWKAFNNKATSFESTMRLIENKKRSIETACYTN